MDIEGQVRVGVVNGYDPTTMTAIIEDCETSGVIHNVACPFMRFDQATGAYSFRAPSEGARCLYSSIRGNTYLIALFSHPNYSEKSAEAVNSIWDNTDNRTPIGMKNYENLRCGNSIDQTSLGSEESFSDSVKKIIIFPDKLSSIWNMINSVWENICSIFRLTSGPMDVYCEVDKENKTTTTIKVRREIGEKEGIPVISLEMGTLLDTPNIIKLKINGNDFLHVDPDRNVKIFAKQIDLNATNINYNADEFNCLNVQYVKLP